MEGRKEDKHRVHAKDLKIRQKHNSANAPRKQPVVLPQQPLPEDILPVADTIEEDQGLDFRDLISKTTSGGSFAFKAEKDWEKDVRLASSFEHLFELDIQRLAKGIATIPFDQRFDLNDVELSNDLLERFKLDAADKERNFSKDIVISTRSLPGSTATVATKKPKELPKMPMQISPAVPINQDESSAAKDDIQNWLDNVLDI